MPAVQRIMAAPVNPRLSKLFTSWFDDARNARGYGPRELPLIVLKGQPPAVGQKIVQTEVAYSIKEPWESLDIIMNHVLVDETDTEGFAISALKLVGMMSADGLMQPVPSDIKGGRVVMPTMVAHSADSSIGGFYFGFVDDNGDEIYQDVSPVPVYMPMIKRPMAAPGGAFNRVGSNGGGGLAGLKRPGLFGDDEDFADSGAPRTPCQRLPPIVSQTGGRSGYDQARFQRDRKLRTGQVDANRHDAALPPAAGGSPMATSVVDIKIKVIQVSGSVALYHPS